MFCFDSVVSYSLRLILYSFFFRFSILFRLSCSISTAATICAVQNESILTKNLFELLTGEDALPYIDASVAQKLLALDKKFNGVADSSDGKYTSLQLRCIAGIADDFGSFQKGFQSEEAAVESLKEWPSHVLADILVKTMNKN